MPASLPVKTDFMFGRMGRQHPLLRFFGTDDFADRHPMASFNFAPKLEDVLMRPRTALAGLLLTAAVIGGGAYTFSPAQPTKQAVPAPSGPPPVPVVADAVKSGNVPIYLRGIGTVQAYNTDTIRTQVQGQITQVAFKEGQTVHAGDLLAQIDPRPFQAQLDRAIANREKDQAQLVNAQANLQRDSQLMARG